MERKPICLDTDTTPAALHPLLAGAAVYDSSSSEEARVFFIDKDGGYFLKSAPRGSLKREAELTGFFHKKQLAPECLTYISEARDWLLTESVPGEDGACSRYLENPRRLCDRIAEILRRLHETDYTGCPVVNRTEDYLEAAARNHLAGKYDSSLFGDRQVYASAEEAWAVVESGAALLKTDVLLHGDYCLPNIILKDWRFSGLIDLGCAGVGDRHIDLFWGIWTQGETRWGETGFERIFPAPAARKALEIRQYSLRLCTQRERKNSLSKLQST